jgi:serine/threonine protein kinase
MAQDHMFALPAGFEVEGYRIGEVLGSGGYGITYKAEEMALGRTVAIKEYLPNSFARRGSNGVTVRPRDSKQNELFAWGLERFRQEAETLVKLQHPNIVRVLRYFAANDTAYIVMVYERGTSLGDRLRGAKTLENKELRTLVEPLLGGIEIVHQARFLHRDIKPDNIYMRGDGSPVLLDFGAARQAIGARTQSITSIVSPGYSPFEQYGTSAGDQGPWTDIYALGATFYRCISGERPPAALDRVAGSITMPAATKLGYGRFDPELLEGIDRALENRAEDRPQSIAEWREILRPRRSRRGAPVAADPGGTLVVGEGADPNASVVKSGAGTLRAPKDNSGDRAFLGRAEVDKRRSAKGTAAAPGDLGRHPVRGDHRPDRRADRDPPRTVVANRHAPLHGRRLVFRGAEVARGEAETAAERAAEMREVGEAAAERDVGDAAAEQERIAEIAPAGLEALLDHPAHERGAFAGEEAMQAPRADAELGGDHRRLQPGIAEPGERQHLGARQGRRAARSGVGRDAAHARKRRCEQVERGAGEALGRGRRDARAVALKRREEVRRQRADRIDPPDAQTREGLGPPEPLDEARARNCSTSWRNGPSKCSV